VGGGLLAKKAQAAWAQGTTHSKALSTKVVNKPSGIEPSLLFIGAMDVFVTAIAMVMILFLPEIRSTNMLLSIKRERNQSSPF
jgi:hypothetical protein